MTMATLRDKMPRELTGGEYHNTRAYALRDVEVTATHDPYNGGKRWPGPQKNVVLWVELANGKAVAWNENVAIGWSFPVITLKAAA
jgi:hypothetical protein